MRTPSRARKADRRNELSAEVKALAAQRDDYLKRQVAERGGAKDSLADKIYGAVRAQAAAKA